MRFTTVISCEQLAAQLDKPDWLIFDCRFSLSDSEAGQRAYRQGHIVSARYLDLNRDLSSQVTSQTGRHPLPDFRQLTQKLISLGLTNRSQVVVYDDASGAFAGRLWWLLRCMGHHEVAVLDGGIKRWQALNLPITPVLPKLNPGSFRAYLDQAQWLNAAQVENGLASRKITLIDARTPERFAGLQEPIDPVAGHIPKAINRPFQRNLDATGRFLPASVLQQQFADLLGKQCSEAVVHMCGSGVTGCHNLLAMEIAGLKGSKLYAGSWSDWIVNRNRAIGRDN